MLRLFGIIDKGVKGNFMDYVALYRKWRPQDFASLVGQEHIKIALSNALTSNRIAHAYLFSGPRGTGKTSTAKILAKAVNCEKGPTPSPCNECTNCNLINQGSSMDVLEIDAASNRGIDEIRELREKIHFLPVEGRKRVYIIDEVHMLTTEAFNALLKTLEEPPEHALFVLATTEPHKIPATILSRCQRYDFRRLGVENTVERLKEVAQNSGLKVTKDALQLIAVQADGGMRDALSLLDQCSVLAIGEINAQVVRSLLGIVGREQLRNLVAAIGNDNAAQALEVLEELLVNGKDIKQIITELNAYFRAVMLFKVTPDFQDIYLTDDKEHLAAVAPMFAHNRLTASSKRLHEATLELRSSIQPRISVEMCLIDLCQVENLGDNVALLNRIEKLEALFAKQPVVIDSIKEKTKELKLPEVKPMLIQETTFSYNAKPAVKSVATPPEAPPPIEKVVEEPVAKIKEVAEKAQEEIVVADEIDVDVQTIWQKTLDSILKEGKKSLHACASQASPATFAAGKFILNFNSEFPCQRMKKADYSTIVEKIISELLGCKVIIDCKSEQVVKEKPAPTKTAWKKADKIPEKEEELPETVKKALEVFGGEVYKIKR